MNLQVALSGPSDLEVCSRSTAVLSGDQPLMYPEAGSEAFRFALLSRLRSATGTAGSEGEGGVCQERSGPRRPRGGVM